jgi:hypothetical protein
VQDEDASGLLRFARNDGLRHAHGREAAKDRLRDAQERQVV